MKKYFIFFINVIFTINSFSQKTEFTSIDDALKHQNNVHSLKIEFDKKYSFAKELPKNLSKCKNLHKIYLSNFHCLEPASLFKLLNTLPKLDTLQIEYCYIPIITKEIGLLRSLKFLGLTVNLTTQIDSGIGNLENLKYLELGYSELKFLPEDFGELINLEYLSINETEILQLPASIIKLKKLKKFDFCCNQLKELPLEFNNLSSLIEIDLSYNKLSEFDSNICKFNNLESLNLSGNTELKIIPESIGNLKKLKNLYLTMTQVEGLPKSLIGHSEIKNIRLCRTFIDNSYYIDSLYSGKIAWETDCWLKRKDVSFLKKYGKDSLQLFFKNDTLIFNYDYEFNEPYTFDEEYSQKIRFKILRTNIVYGKKVHIPDSNLQISATLTSNWFNGKIENIDGHIQILEEDDTKIKLSILLKGIWGRNLKKREFINRTLIFYK